MLHNTCFGRLAPPTRSLPVVKTALLIGILLLGSAPGFASQLKLSFGEIAQTADLIFVGTVHSVTARPGGTGSMIFTDVVFTDATVVNASARSVQKAASTVRMTYPGGAWGNAEVRVSGTPEFAVGHRYLVFMLDDGEPYANPIVGGPQGLLEVVKDAASGEEYVLSLAHKALVGASKEGLQFSEQPVQSIFNKKLVLAAGQTPGLQMEAPPKSADPASKATAPEKTTHDGTPMSLAEFISFIRNQALREPLAARLLRFEGPGKIVTYKDGKVQKEDIEAVAPPDRSALLTAANSLVVPPAGSNEGTRILGAGDLFSSREFGGGTLGACGYHTLSLIMEQVPTSWWSWQINNDCMWTWNQFMDDYRYVADDGTYGNNDENEFAGFVSDASLFAVYGFHWGSGLAATISWMQSGCGRITQSDLLWNSAYSWTDNAVGAIGNSSVILLRPVNMHELGHTWGYMLGSYTETYDYDLPSVMQGYYSNLVEDGWGIHPIDALIYRGQYDDQTSVLTTRDVGVESYYASGGLHNATTNASSYMPGQAITLNGITVENVGTAAVADLRIRFYLSSNRDITTSDYQLGSYWYWTSFPGTGYNVGNYTTTVPSGVPAGTYYVGAIVTINGFGDDDYTYNNSTSLLNSITILAKPTVTIVASDATATEAGPTTGYFTVTRTGSLASALTVYYTVGGTATSGSDYSTLPGNVYIAAGVSSATITVAPVNDSVVESNETVILTLSTNAAYTVGSPSSATVTIVDNDNSVSITAPDNTATEAGPTSGYYTITRAGSTASALTVYYTVGGTATPVSDYIGLQGSIILGAGIGSAQISVTPVNDLLVEGSETVIVTLSPNAAYFIGSPSSATITILDDDVLGPPYIIDNAAAGVSDANRSFTGAWCASGSAGYYGTVSLYSCGEGLDTYRWTPNITTAGTYDVYVWWTAHANRSTNVPITVVHAAGPTTRFFNQQVNGGQWVYHGTYNFNAGMGGFVQAADSNGQACADAVRFTLPAAPTVSISAPDNTATEAGSAGYFLVTRSGSISSSLTVNYTVAGTATPGSDYIALPASFTLGPGVGSVQIYVNPIDDALVEGNETVIVTLSASPDYTIGSASATVTIVDNDGGGEIILDNAPQGVIDATRSYTGTWCSSASAGFYGTDSLYSCGSGLDTYRWTPPIPAAGAYDVYVRWTSHVNRSTAVPITVNYAGGSTVRTFNQQVGGGVWVLHGTYNFNAGNAGYVLVSDQNGQACADAVRFVPLPAGPMVTITSTGTASEAGPTPGSYTVTRTGSTASPLTVNYAVSGTATSGSDFVALSGSVVIPSGSTSAGILLTPIDDALVEGPETVIVTLSANPAYNVGTPSSATITIADNDGGEIILDNAPAGTSDANRSFTGTWCSSAAAGFYGTDSLFSCGGGTDTYRWTPAIPSSGWYDVAVRWTAYSTRGTSVPITVNHASGTTAKNYNQQISGGTWVQHGIYYFNAGSTGYVQVADTNGQASADAVRFRPSAPPEEIILDNAPAGVTDATRGFSGTWCASAAAGFYGTDSLFSCGSGEDAYRWVPSIPSAGAYSVYVRWTAYSTRGTAVPITVVHADGTTPRIFNQQTGGGAWVLHGIYNFSAGSTGYVMVTDAGGQACADAVRFVKLP